MTNLHKKRNLGRDTKPNFSTYRELLEISLEYFPEETQPLQDCLIVGMQHMLGTTVDMFRAMKKLGLKQAIVGSKLYSDNLASINAFKRLDYQHVGCQQPIGYGLYNESITKDVHEIWKNALQAIENSSFRSIIVLDDGADLLLNIPKEIYELCRSKKHFLVGIEQTRGGANRTFFNGLPLPLIHVAGAAIKSRFEYQWVAEKVVCILCNDFFGEIEQQLNRKPRIGIMGHGSMGHAIAKLLSQQTAQISIYDPKTVMGSENATVTHLSTPAVLVSWADVIIGCTGTDITTDPVVFDALHYSPSPKWLVSTSSKDIEFNCLLHTHQRQVKQLYHHSPDILQTAIYRNYYGIPVNVLRGGFPINFQNTLHSVLPEKIWPTRAALLLGCLMALKHRASFITNNASTVYQLDPHAQALIYHRYAQIYPKDPQLEALNSLSDEELRYYFCKHSQGKQSPTYQELYSEIDLTLSHMPSHIYVKSLNGIYLECNDAFVQASCWGNRRAIIGKTDRELWPTSSSHLQLIDQQVVDERKCVTLIEKVATKKGTDLYLSTKMPFYKDGILVGIVGNSIPLPK